MTPRHFAWQAWHKLASYLSFCRGRRGTISHPPSFCVAGVALMGLGGALGPVWSPDDAAALCVAGVAQTHIVPVILHGRRGTISHPPSFCVAGVALMGLGGALGPVWSPDDAAALCVAGVAQTHIVPVILHGRCGTISHLPSFCVAGVAAWHSWDWVARLDRFGRRMTPRHFAWQAWHKLTSYLSFCMAGVAQSHIYLCFAW